jgi:hypothetical protein
VGRAYIGTRKGIISKRYYYTRRKTPAFA